MNFRNISHTSDHGYLFIFAYSWYHARSRGHIFHTQEEWLCMIGIAFKYVQIEDICCSSGSASGYVHACSISQVIRFTGVSCCFITSQTFQEIYDIFAVACDVTPDEPFEIA